MDEVRKWREVRTAFKVYALRNELASRLGLVYGQCWAQDFHAQNGIDLNARNRDIIWEVPLPATILVDRSGIVRNVYVDVGFRKRRDSKEALEWIDRTNPG